MDIRDRLIEEILQTLCYDDMTEDQLALVTEYETQKYIPVIDRYSECHTLSETEEYVHSLWLNYEIADGAEDNLLRHIGSDLMITV